MVLSVAGVPQTTMRCDQTLIYHYDSAPTELSTSWCNCWVGSIAGGRLTRNIIGFGVPAFPVPSSSYICKAYAEPGMLLKPVFGST